VKHIIFTENYVPGGVDTFIVDLIKGLGSSRDIKLLCNRSHEGLPQIKELLKDTSVEFYDYYFFTNSYKYRGYYKSGIFQSQSVQRVLSLVRKIVAYPALIGQIVYWWIFFSKQDASELLVVNGGYPGGSVCRAAGVGWFLAKKKKSILSVHNFREKVPFYRVPFEAFFDALTVVTSRKIVTVSASCLGSLDSNFIFKLFRAKTSFIYNGRRDISMPNDFHAGSLEKRSYFLMLASYEERKGHKDLIFSVKRLKDMGINISVRCYGGIVGDYFGDLSRLIIDLNLTDSIELYDFSTDIEEIFAKAKALVVPSLSSESFGLVAVEAFLRNLPVVAYKTGGLAEVVSKEVGILVKTGDVSGLSRALKLINEDDDLWHSLSNSAREYALVNFSYETMITKYEKLLNDNDSRV
jgi:L-malate glycosyltransferase